MPNGYRGREQAFVKHELLKKYLEVLFLILGLGAKAGSRVELCYVDCFAGPWGDESDELETTSIAISLAKLAQCRDALLAKNIRATIRALYIEEDPRAFARLKGYLDRKTPLGVEAQCREGDFVALRSEILQWAGTKAFVFFFIDPKGWGDIGIPTLQPLLERPNSEFLINFMYPYINRVVAMKDWRPAMRQWLGRDLEIEEGTPPAMREKIIVRAYRDACKGLMRAPTWSASARVMDPEKDRSKYHLIYYTHHPKGAVEFMKISEGVDRVQATVRIEVQQRNRYESGGTLDLFSPAESLPEGGTRVHLSEIESFWKAYLKERGGRATMDMGAFADILDMTDWYERDLQAALARLIATRQVINLDAGPRSRPKRPLHFEDYGGETLELTVAS